MKQGGSIFNIFKNKGKLRKEYQAIRAAEKRYGQHIKTLTNDIQRFSNILKEHEKKGGAVGVAAATFLASPAGKASVMLGKKLLTAGIKHGVLKLGKRHKEIGRLENLIKKHKATLHIAKTIAKSLAGARGNLLKKIKRLGLAGKI